MVCKGKLSYIRSCILDGKKLLLRQGLTQSQQQVNKTHCERQGLALQSRMASNSTPLPQPSKCWIVGEHHHPARLAVLKN